MEKYVITSNCTQDSNKYTPPPQKKKIDWQNESNIPNRECFLSKLIP